MKRRSQRRRGSSRSPASPARATRRSGSAREKQSAAAEKAEYEPDEEREYSAEHGQENFTELS
jgi:hypothetical protein